MIEARYHGATNTKCSRISITSHRFPKDSLMFSYDDAGQTFEQAETVLDKLGYTITAQGETKGGFFFAVNEFRPIRESFAAWKAAGKTRYDFADTHAVTP